MRTLGFALLLLGVSASTAVAQRTTVVVRDGSGAPVPYAFVEPTSGTPVTLDSAGRAELRLRGRDSIFVRVRRIGYTPLDRWVRLPVGDTLALTMGRVALSLDAVQVTARRDSPLEQNGFYNRMNRVQRGATVGHFITPEELELRLPATLAQSLATARFATVSRLGNGRTVILGRGGCAMNIVVNGQLVQGTSQDEVVEQVPTSIRREGTYRAPTGAGNATLDINSLVGGNEITAIEIYPSAANAPYEIQAAASTGRGSCGIVAIWTGGRR